MADGKPEKNDFSSDQSGLSISSFHTPKKRKRNKYAMACSFLASMTSILLGYDIGVMSGAIIYIQRDLNITDIQKEIVMGILNVYSLLGSAAAGRTSDWIGRRYTIILAAAIFFVGALLMGFATNYAFLMVGRFVAGIGVGYALMIAPVYTAELSPASSRGFLTSFPDLFINFGILLAYVSNFIFSRLPTSLGWRIMLGIGAVPSVFIALGVLARGGATAPPPIHVDSPLVLAMPESPRWLVLQGRLSNAKRVLDKTSDSLEESKLRLNDIIEAAGTPEDCNNNVKITKKHHGQGVWRDLLLRPSPAVRHILICAVGIHIFQQASGIDSVVLYSPEIFQQAGITKDRDKLLATMGVGFTKTTVIVVTMLFMDKIGRRPLLLTSVAGMVLSLLGLGIGLKFIEHSNHKLIWAGAVCIACILLYVSSFSVGMGPITWGYSSEIFPLKLRAQGCSIGVALNRVTSGVISMTFISLYKAISIGGAFFLYAGINVVAWVFIYTLLPETRGRTLEEMETLFGTFFKWRSTARALKEKNGQVQITDASNTES